MKSGGVFPAFFYVQWKREGVTEKSETIIEIRHKDGKTAKVPAKDIWLPSRWKPLGWRDARIFFYHKRIFPVNFLLVPIRG